MNNAVRLALNNYAIFHGRTKRQDFWLWYLFTVLLTIPTSIFDRIFFAGRSYAENFAPPSSLSHQSPRVPAACTMSASAVGGS